MNDNEREIKDRTAQYLNNAFLTWQRDQVSKGTPHSQASATAYARELGVSNTSWSQWVNGTRLPVGDNIERLVSNPYIGPQLYTIMGMTPRMPNDPDLFYIASRWHRMPPKKRRAVVDYYKTMEENIENNSTLPA